MKSGNRISIPNFIYLNLLILSVLVNRLLSERKKAVNAVPIIISHERPFFNSVNLKTSGFSHIRRCNTGYRLGSSAIIFSRRVG